MEGSLIFEEIKQVEHIFLHKKFEELCPYFISMGMTYEQFWYGEIDMTKAYVKAFEIKEKRKSKNTRWTIWELGLYIYEALCYVSPILRAFSKAKKPLPYPSKPHGIDDDEKKEERKEKKKETDIMRAQIFFKNWARATQQKFKKKEEK